LDARGEEESSGGIVRYIRILVSVCALSLSACLGSQQPLNPPQLVTARDSDMAIQLFMQATILLARYYGFDTIQYEEIRDRSVRHGYSVIPFMPPVSGRATPRLNPSTLTFNNGMIQVDDHLERLTGAAFRQWANGVGGHRMLMTYYVTTGWRAAQMVCRNYMLGIDERNDFFEFLQKEFNIGTGLASSILLLAGANGTLTSAFLAGTSTVNSGIDEYRDYRFMTIVDRDAARVLVESAQNLYAMDFLGKLNALKIPVDPPSVLFPTVSGQNPQFVLFSDAIQVLHSIEYQCTRPGIRGLLNKAARNTNGGTMTIDPISNAIVFDNRVPPTKPSDSPVPSAKK
jgi:hypothetical protein